MRQPMTFGATGIQSERGSQRSRQSTIRNQDVSKMTEKKGKKMEEEWMFRKPLYFKSFLQGWAQSEKGKAELHGAEETFESSMATQEEPGRQLHIGNVQGSAWQKKKMCLNQFPALHCILLELLWVFPGVSEEMLVQHLTTEDTSDSCDLLNSLSWSTLASQGFFCLLC